MPYKNHEDYLAYHRKYGKQHFKLNKERYYQNHKAYFQMRKDNRICRNCGCPLDENDKTTKCFYCCTKTNLVKIKWGDLNATNRT
jgi:hypothetical protein